VTAGLVVLGAVLVGVIAAGLGWRRRDGRLRASAGQRLGESDLGAPLGARATLVQFSSSFCAPCRATRHLLADLAGRTDGVAHIEIDVAARMDLARQLGILRTPTVLVLGPQGQIARRASGLPRRADVESALALAAGGALAPNTPGMGTKPTRRIGIDSRDEHA
jgi:thiol-disulfide isomerase/thioredoxin